MRLKKRHLLFSLLLFALLIVACRGKNSEQPVESDDAPERSSSDISAGDAPEPSSSDIAGDDDMPHIVWANHVFERAFTKEIQNRIQSFLFEKGINCAIDFLPVDTMGKEYDSWLQKQKKETVPDIIPTGFWEHGTIDAVEYAKRELLPLTEYLETEVGKQLLNSYAEVEWERIRIDGDIYAIPRRPVDIAYNASVFSLNVNDLYKEAFEASFDGSYQSLHDICKEISGSHSILTISRIEFMDPFFGVEEAFKASYDINGQKFIDLTQKPDFKEHMQLIYSDYLDGLLIDINSSEEVSADAFAYIDYGTDRPKEGFTQYVLSKELFQFTVGSYGISAASPNKDLAFRVLSLCYSDPEIASLISWKDADSATWKELTSHFNSCSSSCMTGFRPDITPKEYDIMRDYYDRLIEMYRSVHLAPRGVLEGINPNFPKLLDDFFNTSGKYDEVFRKYNEQFEAWIGNKN